MRLPIDAWRAGEPGVLVHGSDERAADALTAHGNGGEQIREIAGGGI